MSSSERTGNKYRISPELFSRDLEREREFGISDLRIYGYEAEAGMMQIAGEIFAENGITRELCLRCLVMDQAGDVLADAINEAYGDALVTSLILPELFFNGFPFVFEIYYGGARRLGIYGSYRKKSIDHDGIGERQEEG